MKKHQGRKISTNRNNSKFPKDSKQYVLEAGTLADMQSAKRKTAELIKYQWDYYSELARQRNAIQDEIHHALNETCISYKLKKWQRAVKWKYGLHPLSTVGSLNFIGGRFNTGLMVNSEVPTFPGLYLTKDKDTALQEHLGQEAIPSKLTPREVALTAPDSEVIVSISGSLDKIFDLTNKDNLNSFVEIIKHFELSNDLIATAKKLNVGNPIVIKTSNELLKTLLSPDWRQLPSNYDVPSNSQIFGHLIYAAEIEGILYPSKFTGQLCLVVFPRNFVNTESFLMLDDEPPHPKVPAKIDRSNWRICEMDIKELL